MACASASGIAAKAERKNHISTSSTTTRSTWSHGAQLRHAIPVPGRQASASASGTKSTKRTQRIWTTDMRAPSTLLTTSSSANIVIAASATAIPRRAPEGRAAPGATALTPPARRRDAACGPGRSRRR
jgi:hypothetical protein